MNTTLAVFQDGSTLFHILNIIADATNIALALWLLAILVTGAKNKTLPRQAWLAALLPIALVYVVKTLDHTLHLWKSIGSNYSTHSALAVALVMAICFLDRPRRAIAIAVFMAYEILIWLLGFHTWLDIGSTLLVIAPLVWLIQAALKQSKSVALTP